MKTKIKLNIYQRIRFKANKKQEVIIPPASLLLDFVFGSFVV